VLTPCILRYLKVTLICGSLALLIAAGLFELGAFRELDAQLAAFLGQSSAPTIARRPQYWFMLFFAFGIAWTTVDIARIGLKIAIAGAAFAEIITGVWALNLYGVFFSPFASLTAVGVAFAAGMVYTMTSAGRRKRTLQPLLANRISGPMFNALIDSNTSVKFDGEIRQATIVVCEIFNHDELMAALKTQEYVAMTNAFLKNAADFLVERGGYLDECDGESLRVVFGVPLANTEHAAIACKAALDLQTRLDAVNVECEQRWKSRFDFRIGVNSGEVVLAAYGTKRLGSVSLAGEAVEFSRRLCAANNIYGSRILVGSGAFALAGENLEVRPMELIQRHRDDPTKEEVYELLASRGELSPDDCTRRDLFWKGVVFYREEKWDDALANFKLARELHIEDGPADFYIRRIEQLRAGVPNLDWARS
jgi:class 3 adenylate cyclase